MHANSRRSQHISIDSGDLEIRGAAALGSGDISGTVANQLSQSESQTSTEPDLNALLTQLKSAFGIDLVPAAASPTAPPSPESEAPQAGVTSVDAQRSQTIHIGNGTLKASGAGALSSGNISGIVANEIALLPDAPNADDPSIKTLLLQLKAAIETQPDLTPESRTEAVQQVGVLAQNVRQPQKGSIKQAFKLLLSRLAGPTYLEDR